MTTTDQGRQPVPPEARRIRVVLGMVGDKWSLLVVCHLRRGPMRFTELKRAVEDISQRMLTVTLRGLERDGIVTRTVHDAMPPHVTYELTPRASRCARRRLRCWAGRSITWPASTKPVLFMTPGSTSTAHFYRWQVAVPSRHGRHDRVHR